MRPIPETLQVRHHLSRVWEAPDRESLRHAVQGLSTALEAHIEEDADGASLLSVTTLKAPHHANEVEHARKKLYDLWRRTVHLRHDLEGSSRSFDECRHAAQSLAAGVGAMLRSESALIAGTWYEELGVGD